MLSKCILILDAKLFMLSSKPLCNGVRLELYTPFDF